MKVKIPFLVLLATLFVVACSKAPTPYLSVSDKNLTALASQTSAEFTISANVYYRVNNDLEWANLTKLGVNGEVTTYVLNFTQNPVAEDRTGTIRIIGDDVAGVKMYFTQLASEPQGITPESVDVKVNDTSTSFKIYGNFEGQQLEWKVTSDESHPQFVPVPASGKGEAIVQVKFPVNETGKKIKVILPVTIGSKLYMFTINQAAK